MLARVVLIEMTRWAMELGPAFLVFGALASPGICVAKLSSTHRAIDPRGSALASMLVWTTLTPRACPLALPAVAFILAFVVWSSGQSSL